MYGNTQKKSALGKAACLLSGSDKEQRILNFLRDILTADSGIRFDGRIMKKMRKFPVRILSGYNTKCPKLPKFPSFCDNVFCSIEVNSFISLIQNVTKQNVPKAF